MSHEPENPATLEPDSDDLDLPVGDHPLEVAARRGFGPLSPLGADVWHGQGRPCVSCGQLVERGSQTCDSCGQDLSEEMLEKMRQHAGPWYVLEHLRPFPGVSLERIVRQIRRGLITETSIVRGPATDYQWRFAVEAPSLCRYFGRCWNCHHEVGPADTYCPSCLTHLSFQRFPEPALPAVPQSITGQTTVGQPAGAQSLPASAAKSPIQSIADLTKPLTSSATKPGGTANLTKPMGHPEAGKPTPSGPYIPPSAFALGSVPDAASSLTPAPGSAGSVSPPAGAPNSGSTSSPLSRHDFARQTTSPFEFRPAGPMASPVGLPESTPSFRRVEHPPATVNPERQSFDVNSPRFTPQTVGSQPRIAAKSASPELAKLASAVASFNETSGEMEIEPASPALPRAAWIAGAVAVIAIITLIALAT